MSWSHFYFIHIPDMVASVKSGKHLDRCLPTIVSLCGVGLLTHFLPSFIQLSQKVKVCKSTNLSNNLHVSHYKLNAGCWKVKPCHRSVINSKPNCSLISMAFLYVMVSKYIININRTIFANSRLCSLYNWPLTLRLIEPLPF